MATVYQSALGEVAVGDAGIGFDGRIFLASSPGDLAAMITLAGIAPGAALWEQEHPIDYYLPALDERVFLYGRQAFQDLLAKAEVEGEITSEHRAELEEVLARLTDDEAMRMTATLTNMENLWQAFSSVPEDAADMARFSSVHRNWYEESQKAISAIYGSDAPRFTALLAAMSPQKSVKQDLELSVRLWEEWQRDLQSTEDVEKLTAWAKSNPLVIPNESCWQAVVRALSRGDWTADAEGYGVGSKTAMKVEQFRRNLMGNLHAVTLDTWMAQAFAVSQEVFGSPIGYAGISAACRKVADKLTNETGEGWTPAQVQAAVWSTYYYLYEQVSRKQGSQGTDFQKAAEAAGVNLQKVVGEKFTNIGAIIRQSSGIQEVLRRNGYNEQLDSLLAAVPADSEQGEGVGSPEGAFPGEHGAGDPTLLRGAIERAASQRWRRYTETLVKSAFMPEARILQSRDGYYKLKLMNDAAHQIRLLLHVHAWAAANPDAKGNRRVVAQGNIVLAPRSLDRVPAKLRKLYDPTRHWLLLKDVSSIKALSGYDSQNPRAPLTIEINYNAPSMKVFEPSPQFKQRFGARKVSAYTASKAFFASDVGSKVRREWYATLPASWNRTVAKGVKDQEEDDDEPVFVESVREDFDYDLALRQLSEADSSDDPPPVVTAWARSMRVPSDELMRRWQKAGELTTARLGPEPVSKEARSRWYQLKMAIFRKMAYKGPGQDPQFGAKAIRRAAREDATLTA